MGRDRVRTFLEKELVQRFIIGLIIFNSVLIGLETSPKYMEAFGFYIDQADRIILVLFVLEMCLKLYSYRFEFFKDGWNLFDALVIIISIIPSVGASFAVLRALRILRTLRLLNNIPKLKIIIESLLHSIPSIGWISVLLMIVFYIYAVIGYNLFGAEYPQYFGSFFRALFTLFQIMTLESWASGVARPIYEDLPFSSIYFITFILIATYTTLNIFIAIVVNTMNELHQRNLQQEEENIKKFVHVEQELLLEQMNKMSMEIRELKDLVKSQSKSK